MKVLTKTLGLAVAAAIALGVSPLANSALAESTALCKEDVLACPAEEQYPSGTTILASLLPEVPVLLLNGNEEVEIECNSSHYTAKTTAQLAKPLPGLFEELEFGGCKKGLVGCVINVEPSGTLLLLKTGANHGLLVIHGPQAEMVCGLMFRCTYGFDGVIGLVSGTGLSGEPAELHILSQLLDLLAFGVGCPAETLLDALYEILSPKPVYISS